MIVLFPLFANSTFAATIQVPADQPTINAAMIAANNGDTILVANGTYNGPFVINKAVVLTSEYINSNNQLDIQNTVLQMAGAGTVVTIDAVAGNTNRLIGFRIIGGAVGVDNSADGGIRDNQIINNPIGIEIQNNAGGTLEDNIFLLNNIAGIRVGDAQNVLIDDNFFQQNGDAIQWIGDGSGTIANNDIGNQFGVGIFLSGLPQLSIEANDINNNQSDGIRIQLSNATVAGTPDFSIRNNEIHNNPQDGIKIIDNIGAGAADVRFWIERNIIYNNAAA
ncbi:MAG: right-handed parallel beta-helix repeat-containing protein, partial [Bacteroidota bacterium]